MAHFHGHACRCAHARVLREKSWLRSGPIDALVCWHRGFGGKARLALQSMEMTVCWAIVVQTKENVQHGAESHRCAEHKCGSQERERDVGRASTE